jgi:phosphopentomutase
VSKLFRRIAVIVLDSVGIGEAPDAATFGDIGSHTLGHICEKKPAIQLPNLVQLGLANIAPLAHQSATDRPLACFGKMQEVSVGKDTMTGHWELMGLEVKIPFQTYPDGFPAELLDEFVKRTGRNVLCNRPASGTDVLEQFGEQQQASGDWIVYTSADSVFQIAAHEDIIPLDELYQACQVARELTLDPRFAVGRVIARPYVGTKGAYLRTSNRHDYAVAPPSDTVLDKLKAAGKTVHAIGKINDIFCGSGITHTTPTKSNADGIEKTIHDLAASYEGLLFVNLVDFDSLYGHRRDPLGYAACLEAFDAALPEIMHQMRDDDLLIITADHGNDPVHSGTDHTREYVPILAYHQGIAAGKSLGVRATFADLAATILDNFQATNFTNGTSFLSQLED